MYKDISVQLVSLIYAVILSSVYFLKRKYNFLESKIYKSLLVATIVSLVLDILSIFVIDSGMYGEVITAIFSKLYFVSLFTWIMLFIFYVLLNKMSVKYDSFKMLIKKSALFKGWLIISNILLFILLISKIDHSMDPHMYYGDGVFLVYSLGVVGSLFLLIMLLFDSKNISSSKNWSILISIVILSVAFFIQLNYDGIFILGSGISLVTMFLYFTIENPDIKYIEELNALKIAAEDANKAKTNFLASMSHEIRTPMNAIIGLSESILANDIPKSISEDVKNINKAGDTLLEIVNNILDITKIEEGKTKLNNKPYNLADVVAELTNIVNVSIGEKPIKYSVSTIGNIPTLLNYLILHRF